MTMSIVADKIVTKDGVKMYLVTAVTGFLPQNELPQPFLATPEAFWGIVEAMQDGVYVKALDLSVVVGKQYLESEVTDLVPALQQGKATLDAILAEIAATEAVWNGTVTVTL